MEPEQPPGETSDEQKPPSASATTTAKEQQSTNTPPRSYECHFCKRGFTNAQALGGHMNIHRKNKTRKHSSSSSSAAAAAVPPNAVITESPSPTRPRLSPTATTTVVANPFSISHQGNLFSADENASLSFFGHRDTAVVPRNIEQPAGINPSSPEREVDLELRLGHVEVEPPPEASSENKITTTRKFF